MKITYGIIVVDGMPFIKHQLDLIYQKAHQIIICEGGDDTWFKINGRRRSIDGTIDFIQNYPDVDRKITIIQKEWQNKNEMCHEYSKFATGDIIWHLDVDEFTNPSHIDSILELFNEYPNCNTIAIPNFIFWGDHNTIVEAYIDDKWITNWFNYERIFKRSDSYWIHHIPERGYYSSTTNEVIPGTQVPSSVLQDRGIFTYHYSYVVPQNVQDKMKYYDLRTKDCIKPNWYEDTFLKFKDNKEMWIKNGFNVQPVNEAIEPTFPERLKEFYDTPEFLYPLIEDLDRISA